jgi:hypothetical protein
MHGVGQHDFMSPTEIEPLLAGVAIARSACI